MQVVLNHNSAGWSQIYGVTIPTKASGRWGCIWAGRHTCAGWAGSRQHAAASGCTCSGRSNQGMGMWRCPAQPQAWALTCCAGIGLGALLPHKSLVRAHPATQLWLHVPPGHPINSLAPSSPLPVTFDPQFAAWGELVVAQLLIPNASFFGHLCGILAGLLYVLVTSRLPFLPWGSPAGRSRRGGSSRGLAGNGNGGGGGARQGGGRQGGSFFRWLFGGRRQRPRTYGHGTWGGGGAAPGPHRVRGF